MVRFYEGTTGLKTGTTDGAGSCLTATVERQKLGLCAVVMGCMTSKDRFNAARTLLEYGFANWMMYEDTPKLDGKNKVKVLSGVEDELKIKNPEKKSFLIPKGREKDVVKKIEIKESVTAPIEKGEVIGKIKFFLDDKEIGEYPLCANKTIEKMTFGNAFSRLFQSFFRI